MVTKKHLKTLYSTNLQLKHLIIKASDFKRWFKRTKMNKVDYRQEDQITNNPQSCTSLQCSMYRTPRDGKIDIMRQKRDTGIQYRHEKKEDVTGFIPKLIA